MTVTAENWVAPVKINNDIAHACAIDDPALMAPTPNVNPNAPTATPRVTLAMTTDRGRGSGAPARQGGTPHAPACAPRAPRASTTWRLRGSRHSSITGEPRRVTRRRAAGGRTRPRPA